MLRYKRDTRPGLVALYDIRSGNGAGPFLQPRSPHGATFHGHVKLNLMTTAATLTQIDIIISFTNLTAFAVYNHACYNIEILIKLLTFLFNV